MHVIITGCSCVISMDLTCQNFTGVTPSYNNLNSNFNWVSRGNWFCNTMTHDWLKQHTGFTPWQVRPHELILNFLFRVYQSPIINMSCVICFILCTKLSYFLGKRKIKLEGTGKLGHIVAETLLLMMFPCARKLWNICFGHKMFLNKIRNIYVSWRQNLCPQQMLSATMWLQQCVLVCQYLKYLIARWAHVGADLLGVNLPWGETVITYPIFPCNRARFPCHTWLWFC